VLFVSFACRLTLAAVMTLAAVGKLRAPGVFAASLEGFGFVPARLRRPLAVLVPSAELLVALLLALPATVTAGFLAAALLCCGLTAVPAFVVARGQKVACACFGAAEVPMGGRHIVRNAGLLAVACLGSSVALTRGGGVPGEAPGIALAVFAAGLLTTVTVCVDDIAALLRSPAAAGHRGR
jgi:hypothetical protein